MRVGLICRNAFSTILWHVNCNEKFTVAKANTRCMIIIQVDTNGGGGCCIHICFIKDAPQTVMKILQINGIRVIRCTNLKRKNGFYDVTDKQPYSHRRILIYRKTNKSTDWFFFCETEHMSSVLLKIRNVIYPVAAASCI